MDNPRRRNSSSGDKFSFPVIVPPAEESDQFEFGSVTTPGSPNSPADHLFFNGKLLPHVFPVQTPNNFSHSRSTSRTSSISSKDSLMSSRSNSTNSRSSNCSSARTSTSEASERRLSSTNGNVPGWTPARKESNRRILGNQYPHGSSQRWQLIAAAPVLKHQRSRARKVEDLQRKGSKKSRGIDEDTGAEKSWFGRRILRSFVSACKECHAIRTASVEGASPTDLEL